MARAFKRRQGGYVAGLSAEERAVLAWLMQQVLELLTPPEQVARDGFEQMLADAGLALDAGVVISDLDAPDRDPALDRLLPDAHRDDPLVAVEFRRLVGPGLRETKAANLTAAIAALEAANGAKLVLDDEGARVVTVALTDVRLVVGERLGLRDDEDMTRLERQATSGELEEERAWLLSVYDFLTWLQESLTMAMLDGLS
ncbi:MAG: DUF2017 family protein [Dermatophilaceae bacterium]